MKRREFLTALPPLVLFQALPTSFWHREKVKAELLPPVGLQVVAATENSITIAWLPPPIVNNFKPMETVDNYKLRVDGTTVIDVGNVLTYRVDFLSGVHQFEVAAEDNSSNVSAYSAPVDGTTTRVLDDFSTTNARWFDLDLVRSDYAGPLCQVSISGTPTDLATRADVIAAASHGYNLLRVYDQAGSGDYLVPIGGTTPVLKQSTQDSKPCWYGGVMGKASFNDWNGRTHVNVVIASRVITRAAHTLFGGGSISGGAGKQLYGTDGQWYAIEHGLSSYVHYNNAWTRALFGSVHRYHYDGSQSTDATKLQVHVNHISRSGADSDSSVGPVPTTFSNATGFYIGGIDDGTDMIDNEFFSAYYFGYNIDTGWTRLKNAVGGRLFRTTHGQVFFSGDSLTESYNLNGTDPTHTYPSQVITSLGTDTGRTWTRLANGVIAEVAAASRRIRQLASSGGPINIDDWCENRIAVVTAGSNDLAYDATIAAQTFTADPATDIITTSSAHGLPTGGVPVRVSNSGGALPTGLSAGVSYLPMIIDATHYKLASSPQNYEAGIAVNITGAGSGTNTATPTVDAAATLASVAELISAWFDFGVDRVIVDTLTPRTDLSSGNSAFATGRTAYNSGLAAAVPMGTELIDFGDDPDVQDPADTSWYFDNVHGTLAFYTKKAAYVTAKILGLPLAPTASFTVDVDSGSPPLTVHFTDTSIHTPTSWSWDFGDGATSTSQNPSHTYSTPGSYDVVLTATNAGGSDDSPVHSISVSAPELANADIPNLVARWKATSSDIVALADGADVSSWLDFSLNSHDATWSSGTSGAKWKKQTVGGKHCIRMVEAAHVYMPFANPLSLSAFTIYVVASTNNDGTFISGDSGAPGFVVQTKDKSFYAGHFGLTTGTAALTNDVKYIRSWSFDTATGVDKLRLNGADNGSTTHGAFPFSQPLGEIGSDLLGTGDWMDGDMYEIIVCNAVHSDADKDAIEAALNAFHNAF